jgi:hypothetical protein
MTTLSLIGGNPLMLSLMTLSSFSKKKQQPKEKKKTKVELEEQKQSVPQNTIEDYEADDEDDD